MAVQVDNTSPLRFHADIQNLANAIRKIIFDDTPEVQSLRKALKFYSESPDGQYDVDIVVPLLERRLIELIT